MCQTTEQVLIFNTCQTTDWVLIFNMCQTTEWVLIVDVRPLNGSWSVTYMCHTTERVLILYMWQTTEYLRISISCVWSLNAFHPNVTLMVDWVLKFVSLSFRMCKLIYIYIYISHWTHPLIPNNSYSCVRPLNAGQIHKHIPWSQIIQLFMCQSTNLTKHRSNHERILWCNNDPLVKTLNARNTLVWQDKNTSTTQA